VNDCSPEIGFRSEVAERVFAVCRPSSNVGKAEALREETSACTAGSAGVGVQATRERSAEITSGRASMQQGLTATCKDRPSERGAKRGGESRSGAWASRSDDGGVTPAEVMGDITLVRVTPGRGKGALDIWRFSTSAGHWAGRRSGTDLEDKPANRGVYASQRLSLRSSGKVSLGLQPRQDQNRTREIRLSGIVGGPAETWTMGEATWARPAETPKQPSLRLPSRAPQLYPDRRPTCP
jgi:hypothetical protein